MIESEEKGFFIYEGYSWSNSAYNVSQWSNIDPKTVEWVVPKDFTYQCSVEDAYEKHLLKSLTRIPNPTPILLVKNSVRIY
ncbi:MAG: hypothetical protein ACRC0F_03850 [Cetobacterium sp.]